MHVIIRDGVYCCPGCKKSLVDRLRLTSYSQNDSTVFLSKETGEVEYIENISFESKVLPKNYTCGHCGYLISPENQYEKEIVKAILTGDTSVKVPIYIGEQQQDAENHTLCPWCGYRVNTGNTYRKTLAELCYRKDDLGWYHENAEDSYLAEDYIVCKNCFKTVERTWDDIICNIMEN